jgi:hypothetical protein
VKLRGHGVAVDDRASYALSASRDVILARQFGQVAHEESLRAVLQSLMKAS